MIKDVIGQIHSDLEIKAGVSRSRSWANLYIHGSIQGEF